MATPDRRSSARYAVVFRAGAEASTAGALVVDDDHVVLEGRDRDGLIELRIPYSELTGVRIGRSPAERLNDRPALLLERRDGQVVQVGPFAPGLLQELAHLLATLACKDDNHEDEVAVVVPLRAGSLHRAQELVRRGPPFDPAALGLTRHEVFLTPDAALFVFAGPGARASIQRATRDPGLWRLGLAWRDCIGGRPHVGTPSEMAAPRARPAYSWTAAHV